MSLGAIASKRRAVRAPAAAPASRKPALARCRRGRTSLAVECGEVGSIRAPYRAKTLKLKTDRQFVRADKDLECDASRDERYGPDHHVLRGEMVGTGWGAGPEGCN
jgi:hypothetical protein